MLDDEGGEHDGEGWRDYEMTRRKRRWWVVVVTGFVHVSVQNYGLVFSYWYSLIGVLLLVSVKVEVGVLIMYA